MPQAQVQCTDTVPPPMLQGAAATWLPCCDGLMHAQSCAGCAGVSAQQGLDVNSLAVPRAAKEAIGAIARMTHREGHAMTINVEYNQLEPVLLSGGFPQGDVPDDSGRSPFPGARPSAAATVHYGPSELRQLLVLAMAALEVLLLLLIAWAG